MRTLWGIACVVGGLNLLIYTFYTASPVICAGIVLIGWICYQAGKCNNIKPPTDFP